MQLSLNFLRPVRSVAFLLLLLHLRLLLLLCLSFLLYNKHNSLLLKELVIMFSINIFHSITSEHSPIAMKENSKQLFLCLYMALNRFYVAATTKASMPKICPLFCA